MPGPLTIAEPISEALETLRVLVVDHDSAESTALILSMNGHKAEIAKDGPTALEAIEIEEPDVILLDLDLPGTNALEVARWIKARRCQKTPFLVALSGYGREEDYRRSLEAGIDLHLVHPVDLAILMGFLERFRRVVG